MDSDNSVISEPGPSLPEEREMVSLSEFMNNENKQRIEEEMKSVS